MSKILTAALVFAIGFSVAIVIALGKKVDWQWLLLFPTVVAAIFAYRHFSEEQFDNTDLIGAKGGRSHRSNLSDEYDDEE
jgi:hypothetical protein